MAQNVVVCSDAYKTLFKEWMKPKHVIHRIFWRGNHVADAKPLAGKLSDQLANQRYYHTDTVNTP